MHYFATFFDKNYLSRGVVLYNSIKNQSIPFTFFVLCLDDFTESYFTSNNEIFANVVTVKLSDVEFNDPELLGAKKNRSIVEYYFTLSPCLPLYILYKYNLPHICTLDADILFYSNPAQLFNWLHEFSIIITPHKFSKENSGLVKWGKYNVSFQIFKNDGYGLQCLNTWRNQCIEWCRDYFDEANNRFADQKYLDSWLDKFQGKVKVLDDNCSGIAPWNINNYKLERKDNHFIIGKTPLIYYHFQHFKVLNSSTATNGFNMYKVKVTNSIRAIYLDYWQKIEAINSSLNIVKDSSRRVNLSQKMVLKIIEEKEAFLKIGSILLAINTNQFPKIFIKVLKKIYS